MFPHEIQAPLAHYRTCRARVLQKFSFTVLASGAMLAAPSSGRAATDIYIGNGASNSFSTGFNATPVNGDTLLFGAPGAGGRTVTDDLTLTVGGANADGIDFSAAAAAPYTISGNALTLGSTGTGIGINDLSFNSQSVSTPLTLASAQTFNVANTNSTLNVGGISGAFTLTKTGAGLLSLNGAGSFSNLVVLGGTVQAGGDNNLGVAGGTITLNGGTLRTSLNGNFGFSPGAGRAIFPGDAGAGTGGTIDTGVVNPNFGGVLSNNGGANSFTKTGAGILNLTNTSAYTGATILNQGTLMLDYNGSSALPNFINGASALVMGGISTVLGTVPDGNKPALQVQGAGGGAKTQSFSGLTLNRDTSQISARGVGASNVTVELGAITQNPGSLVAFSTFNAGGTGVGVITTTRANDASGILGGWAVINPNNPNGAGFATPTDHARVNGSGQIVTYTGYTAQAAGVIASNPLNNDRVTPRAASL